MRLVILVACNLAAVLLICPPALSDTDPAPPSLLRCERHYPLIQGDTAPCAGLLVPGAEAVQAATCVRVDLPRCERRRVREHEEVRVRLAASEKLRAISDDALAATERLLQEALALSHEGPAWYESPEFVAPASAVVTLAAVLLILYGAGAL